MKDSKNLVIGMLCAVICVMAVAYAAFSTQLTVTGTATITSEWGVEIVGSGTSCAVTNNAGAATVTDGNETYTLGGVASNVTSSTATFDITLIQPGDVVTCTVSVTNTGTLNAKVSDLVIGGTKETSAIVIAASGIEKDQVLNAKDSTTFTITATYKGTVTSQPAAGDLSATITVTPTFVQA